MHMIRKATSADRAALAELERSCFGDDGTFIGSIFDRLAGMENIWLAEENGMPVSMALTVPVTFDGRHGAYLYALATAAAARRQGFMTALLEHLKAAAATEDWHFFCLIPADGAARAFYEKRGFVPFAPRRLYEPEFRRNLYAVAEFDDITVELLPRLRKKFCGAADVQLTPDGLIAMLTDYYSMGGSTVRTGDGYGFFRVEKGRLLFDEFFARDERGADLLLQASREKIGCTVATVLTDDVSLLHHGRGKEVPYAMWWSPDGGEAPCGYMGMMLEI